MSTSHEYSTFKIKTMYEKSTVTSTHIFFNVWNVKYCTIHNIQVLAVQTVILLTNCAISACNVTMYEYNLFILYFDGTVSVFNSLECLITSLECLINPNNEYYIILLVTRNLQLNFACVSQLLIANKNITHFKI